VLTNRVRIDDRINRTEMEQRVENERLKIGRTETKEEFKAVNEEKLISPILVDNKIESETLRLKMVPDRKLNSHQQAKVFQFSIPQILF